MPSQATVAEGPEEETAQQHGQLGEVQLVKLRGQEEKGEIQHVQHRRNGGTDAYDGHPAGWGYLPLFGHEPLGQPCQQRQRHDDGDTHQKKGQVFLNFGHQIAHNQHLIGKKITL